MIAYLFRLHLLVIRLEEPFGNENMLLRVSSQFERYMQSDCVLQAMLFMFGSVQFILFGNILIRKEKRNKSIKVRCYNHFVFQWKTAKDHMHVLEWRCQARSLNLRRVVHKSKHIHMLSCYILLRMY